MSEEKGTIVFSESPSFFTVSITDPEIAPCEGSKLEIGADTCDPVRLRECVPEHATLGSVLEVASSILLLRLVAWWTPGQPSADSDTPF